ncbi:DEKNAAC103435 [Brettanomyces naardenensis]|uniref:DEKNAAC103435 n=1 Tax=Brettanomyces naardenensis TaxID=13370 RepID=A0A448YN60_BRENA|nr:DEKNAAC103435 [Brettanomyces naardenensis]
MSPNKDKLFMLGSSPTKELDQLFDDQNIPETGWTPYIDKIFGTGTPANHGTPTISTPNALYRASPSQHRRSAAPRTKPTPHPSRTTTATPHPLPPPPTIPVHPDLYAASGAYAASRLFSSPSFSFSLQQSQQTQSFESFTLNSSSNLVTSLRTPLADKSFRVSDCIFDTPSFLQQTDELYPSIDAAASQANRANQSGIANNMANQQVDKENDPLLLGVFSTPSANKSFRFFKTPGSARLNANPSNLVNSGNLATAIFQPTPYKTPLKNNINRAALNALDQNVDPSMAHLDSNEVNGGPIDSSPSTILLTSTIKKDEGVKLNGVENSPTPATKSHLKKPPCQLVRSNSALEPAMGLFHDGETRPRTASAVPPANLPLLATFSSTNSAPTGRKRKTNSGNSGNDSGGKFQIIFADMNTMRASYSNRGTKKGKKQAAGRKKGLTRFKTVPAVLPSDKATGPPKKIKKQ